MKYFISSKDIVADLKALKIKPLIFKPEVTKLFYEISIYKNGFVSLF